jgi:hypothetical protein
VSARATREDDLDRWARIALGVVLVGAGLAAGGWVALVLYLLVVTAVAGFCPICRLRGIDTCKMSKTCAESWSLRTPAAERPSRGHAPPPAHPRPTASWTT